MQAKSLFAVVLGYSLILSPIAYAAWTVCHTAAYAIQHAQATPLWAR